MTDLRGRMVMPGLHDGHIHGITEAADACSLNYEPLTVAELTARLQACLDATPGEEPGGWLQASSWYQQFVLPAGTVVTREVLDGLRTQRPIVVSSSDGHTSLVNSRGLALAGITAATPDPANGRIEHDAAGRAERPAPGRRAGPRERAAPAAHRGPGRRGAPRHAALRARGHHLVLRARASWAPTGSPRSRSCARPAA